MSEPPAVAGGHFLSLADKPLNAREGPARYRRRFRTPGSDILAALLCRLEADLYGAWAGSSCHSFSSSWSRWPPRRFGSPMASLDHLGLLISSRRKLFLRSPGRR